MIIDLLKSFIVIHKLLLQFITECVLKLGSLALKTFKKNLLFFQSPKLEDLLHVSKLGGKKWVGYIYAYTIVAKMCYFVKTI